MVRQKPIELQQKEDLREAANQLEAPEDHSDTGLTLDPVTQAPRTRKDASREVGGENQGHEAGEKELAEESAEESAEYPTPTPEPEILDTIVVRIAGSGDRADRA